MLEMCCPYGTINYVIIFLISEITKNKFCPVRGKIFLEQNNRKDFSPVWDEIEKHIKRIITVQFLQSFADAFNAHDINAIMSHMTDDCVFEASAGPDFNGEKFAGQQQVKKAFEQVFETFPDANWGNTRHFVLGNRGFTEWIFTGTKIDGTKLEVTGCDLFTFNDGKIAVKNSYRKNRFPK